MIVTQAAGPAPFPWQIPWTGLSRVSPTYVISKVPKTVLLECFILWSVSNIQVHASIWIFWHWKHNDATEWKFYPSKILNLLSTVQLLFFCCLIISNVSTLFIALLIALWQLFLPNCYFVMRSHLFWLYSYNWNRVRANNCPEFIVVQFSFLLQEHVIWSFLWSKWAVSTLKGNIS